VCATKHNTKPFPKPPQTVADVASLADAVVKSLGPTAETFAALDLPAPLVKFGHPANMATVLLAMGGYGSYLGWQIRTSDDTVRRAVFGRVLGASLCLRGTNFY
jgi:hypothetical protein